MIIDVVPIQTSISFTDFAPSFQGTSRFGSPYPMEWQSQLQRRHQRGSQSQCSHLTRNHGWIVSGVSAYHQYIYIINKIQHDLSTWLIVNIDFCHSLKNMNMLQPSLLQLRLTCVAHFTNLWKPHSLLTLNVMMQVHI